MRSRLGEEKKNDLRAHFFFFKLIRTKRVVALFYKSPTGNIANEREISETLLFHIRKSKLRLNSSYRKKQQPYCQCLSTCSPNSKVQLQAFGKIYIWAVINQFHDSMLVRNCIPLGVLSRILCMLNM